MKKKFNFKKLQGINDRVFSLSSTFQSPGAKLLFTMLKKIKA